SCAFPTPRLGAPSSTSSAASPTTTPTTIPSTETGGRGGGSRASRRPFLLEGWRGPRASVRQRRPASACVSQRRLDPRPKHCKKSGPEVRTGSPALPHARRIHLSGGLHKWGVFGTPFSNGEHCVAQVLPVHQRVGF